MTGSDDWWQGISGPQAEAVGDGYRVTFWWRDPAGSEETSLTKRVWIYITGVTDHHQNAVPQTLKRVPGTDAWQWQTTLSPAWRGSYCFIPSDRDDDFALRFSTAVARTVRCCGKAGADCCRGR